MQDSGNEQEGIVKLQLRRLSGRGRFAAWQILGCYLAVLGFLAATALAQAPPFEWVRSAGGAGSDQAYAIAVDANTNIYVTGHFVGTAYFGAANLTAASGDIFIAKFDRTGTPVWLRKGGTGGVGDWAEGKGIAVDSLGNVYVTGDFSGTLNTGSTTLTTLGSPWPDAFVIKYSNNGSTLWAKRAGGSDTDFGYGIVIDSLGNCHVVGFFAGTGSFGVTNLGSAGSYDIFHASYDIAGNLLWARKAGGLGDDMAFGIAADSAGSTYVVGRFGGPSNFGGIPLSGFGGFDVFIAKYDSTGNVLWARQGGGTSDEYAYGIAANPAGECSITGSFYGSASFSGIGLTSAGYTDVFVARYDSAGTVQWARRAGSTMSQSAEQGSSVAVDAAGNCYVTGFFQGTASFGSSNLVSSGGKEIFIAKYDSAGTLVWAKKAGLVFDDSGNGIALDNSGNAYVAGTFYDSATFDSTNILGSGVEEIFLAKLPAVVPVPPTITAQPQSQSVRAGSDATFAVTAAGTLPLNYQWRFFGTNLVQQTNATLFIPNVQAANEGDYTAVVANIAGSVTSSVARLTILLPPSIVIQPQSLTVIAGQNAVFNVGVTGTPPLALQWRLGTTNLAGATSTTLNIPNAQPVNAGSYTVVVTNAQGAVTSSVATLTVRYSLTLVTNGQGRVTREPDQPGYPPNFPVTLTATPEPGSGFLNWSGDAAGTNNPLSVTMTTNKVILANFFSTVLSVDIIGQGTMTRLPDKSFYAVGESVTLTAVPGRWHRFDRWQDGPTLNPRTVTIGLSNHYTAIFASTTAVETLTYGNVSRTAPVGMPAIFVDGEFVVTGAVQRVGPAEISLLTTYPNGLILYTLDGSEPSFRSSLYFDAFTLHRSATIRALAFDAFFSEWWETDPVRVDIEPLFSIQTAARGGGIITLAPDNGPYRSNTTVTLTATPAPGWTLLEWFGDLNGSAPTQQLAVARHLCIEALFGTSLSITSSVGGTIVVVPPAALYPCGAPVQLVPVPEPGYAFVRWGNAASGTNQPLWHTITNPAPGVSALFAPLNAGDVSLTVVPSGFGHVQAEPPAGVHRPGRTVTLTAVPDKDQQFLGWSGDASGQTNPLNAVMDRSRVITALFTQLPRVDPAPCPAERPAFVLRVSGWPGAVQQLETSADLSHWQPLAVVTNAHGETQFTDFAKTNQSQRFYRVVQP